MYGLGLVREYVLPWVGVLFGSIIKLGSATKMTIISTTDCRADAMES